MATNQVKGYQMKRYILLLSGFIILMQPESHAQEKNLRYEILLNNKMLGDSIKNISFSACLDISPENLVTLSDGSLIYLLGWGGITSIGNKSNQPINEFAYSSDGLLFAIAGNDLCHISKDGNWKSLVRLPHSQMSISRGKEVMYIYDHNLNDGKYYAYALAKGGKYRHLFTSPKPVNGIIELGDSIYVAVESGIYSYSPQTGNLIPLFALGREDTITSLSADPEQPILYFSTRTSVYALKNSSLVRISEDFPDSIVRYSGNGLLIFNPRTKDILHIVNIEKSIEF
jgi:hypothetical protein